MLTAALLWVGKVNAQQERFVASAKWSSGIVVPVQPPFPAPHLIIVTDGPRVVLSARVDEYDRRGAFLMVVPMEAAVGVPHVSSLPTRAFTQVHNLSAPRLLELWECDPCNLRECDLSRPPLATQHEPSEWKATPSKPISDAAFDFEGYELAFVRRLAGVRGWLEQQGLESVLAGELDPYAGSSWSFLIARRAPTPQGSDTPDALRISYQTQSLQLPLMLPRDEQGRSEILVHVIARERQSIHGIRSIQGPPGSEVSTDVPGHFSEFYEKQVQPLLGPEGVLLEYANSARECHECVERGLHNPELTEFGVDLVFPRGVEKQRSVVLGPKLMKSDRRAYVAAALEICDRSSREGSFTLRLEPRDDSDLRVSVVRGKPSTELMECVRQRVRRLMQGQEADTVTFDLTRAEDGQVLQRELEQDVPLVLTRLRARFDRPREQPLSLKADSGANFQATYEVRHPWRGKVTCASPEFGHWGVPPREGGVYEVDLPRAVGDGAVPTAKPQPPPRQAGRFELALLIALGVAALVLGLIKLVSRNRRR